MRFAGGAIGFLIATATANLATASPIRLEVRGDACMLDGLDAKIGDEPGGHDVTPATVQIATSRDGHRVIATVVFDDGGGHVRGPRVVAATSCDELGDAVALVIALALPIASPPPAARPIEVTSGPVPMMELHAVTAPHHDAPAPRSLYAAGVAGREVRVIGGLRVRRGDRSLGIELGFDLPERLAIDAHARITVWTAAVTASPCLHRGAFAGCATVTAGAVTGAGKALIDARTAVSPLIAGGLRVIWEPALTSRIAARLQVDIEARATSTHFAVDRMTVWSTERNTVRAGAGVVIHFP